MSVLKVKPFSDCVTDQLPNGSDTGLLAIKKKAKAHFDKIGFPTQKQESWKYVDVDSLLSQSYETVTSVNFKVSGYKGQTDLVADLSDTLALGCSTSPFSYLNTAYFSDAITVVIEKSIQEPIIIKYQPTAFCYPRLNIRVKDGVSATVFLQAMPVQTIPVQTTSGGGVENRMIDVQLDQKASLSLIQCDMGHTGYQLSSLIVSLQEGSHFNNVSYNQNNIFSRRDTQVDFYGENATATLRGIGLYRDSQQYFNHLTINHHVGNCNCKQLFKTVLTDKAISEFSGLVFVNKGAHGTDSSQLNHNLLLSDNARALSRPQLRIDADDVECAHGATVGQLNPDEVFYIRSRGITDQYAKQLLTFGFAQEVLDYIDNESIKLELVGYLKKEINCYVND